MTQVRQTILTVGLTTLTKMSILRSAPNNSPDVSLAAKLANPKWTNLNEDQPFYDRTTNEYCIVVATEHETVDENIFAPAQAAAIKQGVKNLLFFYDKDIHTGHARRSDGTFRDPTEAMQDFLDTHAADMARSDTWHLDARPCSKLRFLVRVNTDIFDELPDTDTEYISTNLEEIQASETEEGIEPEEGTEKIINIPAKDLDSKIKDVAEVLDKYAMEMYAFTNTASRDLNLDTEAKRLRSLSAEIKKMLVFNNIRFDQNSNAILQFGFGGESTEYELKHVAVKFLTRVTFGGSLRVHLPLQVDAVSLAEIAAGDLATTSARVLKAGYASLKEGSPGRFSRTRKYFSELEEIHKELTCPERPDWYDFITKYSRHTWNFLNSKWGQRIMCDVGARQRHHKRMTVHTAGDLVKKREEQSQARLAEDRKQCWNFVGAVTDSRESLKELLDEVTDYDSMWEKFLNKTGWKYITGLAAKILAHHYPPGELQAYLFDVAMRGLDDAELWEVWTETKGCLQFEDVIDKTQCPDVIKEQILEKLGELSEEDREKCLKIDCPPLTKMFGWRNELDSFIKNSLITQIDYGGDQLCGTPLGLEEGDSRGWGFGPLGERVANYVQGGDAFPEAPSRPVASYLPTSDIFGDIAQAAQDAAEAAFREMFVQMVKAVILSLVNAFDRLLCNFDDQLDLFTNGWDGASDYLVEDVLLEAGVKAPYRVFTQTMKDFGIVVASDEDFANSVQRLFEDEPSTIVSESDLRGFISDLSDCLTPGELVSALRGESTGPAEQTIYSLADKHFGKRVQDALGVLAQVGEGGDYADLSGRIQAAIGGDLCSTDRVPTPAEREELKQALEVLATPADQFFQSPPRCQDIKNGCDIAAHNHEPKPLIPKDATPVLHMNKMVMDTMFTGVENQYNQEITSYPSKLVQVTMEQRQDDAEDREPVSTILPGLKSALVDPDKIVVRTPGQASATNITFKSPVLESSNSILVHQIFEAAADGLTDDVYRTVLQNVAIDGDLELSLIQQRSRQSWNLENLSNYGGRLQNTSPQQLLFAYAATEKFSQAVPNAVITPMFNNLKHSVYTNVMRTFLNRITREISQSELLSEVEAFNNLELNPPVPPASFKCPDGWKKKEGLLRISSAKDQALEDFNNAPCIDTSEGGQTAFEKAAGKMAARLMVRIIVVEVVLKNVYALSKFKYNQVFSRDNLMKNFIYKIVESEIGQGLSSNGPDSIGYEEFIEQLLEGGEDTLQSVLEEEAAAVLGEIPSIMADFPENRKIDVRNLVFNELDRTLVDVPTTSEFPGRWEQHPVVVDQQLPDEYAARPDEYPYQGTPTGLIYPAPLPSVYTPHGGGWVEGDAPDPSPGRIVERDLGGGKLVLERILKVKPHPVQNMPLGSEHIFDTLRSPPDYPSEGYNVGEFFDQQGDPVESIRNINSFVGWFQEYFEPTPGTLGDYFEIFEYGLRLTYLLPNNLETAEGEPVDGAPAIREIQEFLSTTASDESTAEDFSKLCKNQKAYRIRIRTAGHRREGEEVLSEWEEIFNIPFAIETISIGHIGTEQLLGVNINTSRDIFGDWSSNSAIFRAMRDNEDVRMLLDFAVSPDRLLTLASIYCMEASGLVNQNLQSAFKGTKEQLLVVLNSLRADDDPYSLVTYEDPGLHQQGGNAGMLQSALASTSTSSPSALMTVSMMIKGIAEQIDPAYSYMKQEDAELGEAIANLRLPTPLGLAAIALPDPPGDRASTAPGGEELDIDRYCTPEEG